MQVSYYATKMQMCPDVQDKITKRSTVLYIHSRPWKCIYFGIYLYLNYVFNHVYNEIFLLFQVRFLTFSVRWVYPNVFDSENLCEEGFLY